MGRDSRFSVVVTRTTAPRFYCGAVVDFARQNYLTNLRYDTTKTGSALGGVCASQPVGTHSARPFFLSPSYGSFSILCCGLARDQKLFLRGHGRFRHRADFPIIVYRFLPMALEIEAGMEANDFSQSGFNAFDGWTYHAGCGDFRCLALHRRREFSGQEWQNLNVCHCAINVVGDPNSQQILFHIDER